jgi:hypothetical protein
MANVQIDDTTGYSNFVHVWTWYSVTKSEQTYSFRRLDSCSQEGSIGPESWLLTARLQDMRSTQLILSLSQ